MKYKHQKLITNKFTKKSWIMNCLGERSSRKFVIYDAQNCGPFTTIYTDVGSMVYMNVEDGIVSISNFGSDGSVCRYSDNLYEVYHYRGGNCLLYDEKGAFVLAVSKIRPSSIGYSQAKKNGKWGILDDKANWLLPPCSDTLIAFNAFGYAELVNGEQEKIQIIDLTGKIVLEINRCASAYFMAEDIISIEYNNKRGVCDITGNVIIPAIYDQIQHKGVYFIVRSADKYGLIDNKGQEIFECIYSEIIEAPDKFIVKDIEMKEIQKQKQETQ